MANTPGGFGCSAGRHKPAGVITRRLTAVPDQSRRRLAIGLAPITLAEGDSPEIWVETARIGTYLSWGTEEFEITAEEFSQMIQNFESGTFGQEIYFDLNHNPEAGVAGTVLKIEQRGNSLYSLVRLSPYGMDGIQRLGMRYVSIEYAPNYVDRETRVRHGAVMFGAAFTPRPFIKRMAKVELPGEDNTATSLAFCDLPYQGMHNQSVRMLSDSLRSLKMKWIDVLRRRLKDAGHSDDTISRMVKLAESRASAIGEDEAALRSLADDIFAAAGPAPTAAPAPAAATQAQPVVALDEAQVNAIVERRLAESEQQRQQQAADAARRLTETRTAWTAAVDAAQGLDDDLVAELRQFGESITEPMQAAVIAQLSAAKIEAAKAKQAQRRLAAMGMGPVGTARVSIDDTDAATKLLGMTRERLQQSPAFDQFRPVALSDRSRFVQQAVTRYLAGVPDRVHEELRCLQDPTRKLTGEVGLANSQLPVGVVGVVIEEAFSDQAVMGLVEATVDYGRTESTDVPYEERDVGHLQDGQEKRYEQEDIEWSGVTQKMDTAYAQPLKLGIKLSHEVINFSRLSAINWDAMARSVASTVRLAGELTHRDVANHIATKALSHASVAVAGEVLTAQVDGTASQFKTVNFPIVPPFQARNLKGQAVGAESNPITVLLNGNPITQYAPGVAAGTYWRLTSSALGFISLVDETGAAVAPANGTPLVISYSRATNIVKFDIDVPAGVEVDTHYDGIYRAVGDKRAQMSEDNFREPNFLLGKPTFINGLSKGRVFTSLYGRDGARSNQSGDANAARGIPITQTNAPGLIIGSVMGIIGTERETKYSLTSAPSFDPFTQVMNPSTGKFTGEVATSMTMFHAIHTPLPNVKYYGAVLAYSATARAAA